MILFDLYTQRLASESDLGRFSNRRGSIFIILVVTLLFGLAAFGVHHFSSVSAASRDITVITLGDRGLYFAESALDEAFAEIGTRMNTPGDEYFQKIRSDLIDGGAATGVKLAAIDPVETKKLMATKEENPFVNFEMVGNVEVEILNQKPFTQIPYEKYGLLKLTSEVRGLVASKKVWVKRKATAIKEFKVVLISTPRPFDQMPLYINDVTGILKPEQENAYIANSIDQIKARIPEAKAEVRAFIQQKESEYGGSGMGDFPSFYAILDKYPLNTTPIPLAVFPEDPVLYVPKSIAEINDLTRVDLQTRLAPLHAKVQVLDSKVKASITKLFAAIQSAIDAENLDGCKPELEEFAKSLKELSDLHHERMALYQDFRNLFFVAAGDDKNKIAPLFYKFNFAEWEAKATHQISGNDTLDQLKAMMTKYTPLNGVILVRNTQPVSLSGLRFTGKTVLVFAGDVELGSTGVQDMANHTLTVISYGKMRVNGTVDASLVPMGTISMMGTARIKGNLVFNRVNIPKELKGTLAYDEKIFSGTTTSSSSAGAKINYYFAGLGPKISALHLDRSQLAKE